jgi:demethylmenaquinone methyltransferase/2-methoxy-6-polyprenyl-1,4-benzoquinol methylase
LILQGTGDLAMMAQTKAENYWFRYLCWYARGRRKENCFKNLSTTIEMILGDSENMPEDNYFDAITVAGT